MRQQTRKYIPFIAVAFTVLVASITAPLQAFALTDSDYSIHDILYYRTDINKCSPDTNSGVTNASGVGGTGNKDYAGRDILSSAVLSAVQANQPTYEAAAKESGVPWQMIAVLHLRETGLKKVNPGNGQGLYQDYAKINGPYPPGPVSDSEFLRQSVWAGNFLKAKATTPDLLVKGDIGQVKDAFFGYNGRSGAYLKQAQSLGFTQGADGSPYVVNKIDAKRDPTTNPTGWGQIKTDGGSISYPANSDYGAFVVYSSLAGIGTSDCSSELSGSLNAKIVTVAQKELALWTGGQLKPGTDYQKYTYGASNDWCAWFVSYVLKNAGHPVDSTATPQWPAVKQFLDQSSTLGFVVHPAGDGYKPKAGDLAIYGGNDHINIVTGYSTNGQMLTIGGNQGAGPNGNFTSSSVTQNTGYGESATSYVEVK